MAFTYNKLMTIEYSGFLKIDPPLSKNELSFLKKWQSFLKLNYKKDRALNIGTELLNLSFTSKSFWILSYAFYPNLKFTKNSIIFSGESPKGNLREAVLMYHHLFLSNKPFFVNSVNSFFTPHTINGEVFGLKNNVSFKYTVIDSCFFSNSLEKEDKIPTYLNKYFDYLIPYLNLQKTLIQKDSFIKKIKI